MWEHKNRLTPGFTSAYGVSPFVRCEAYPHVTLARQRESTLKRWRRA